MKKLACMALALMVVVGGCGEEKQQDVFERGGMKAEGAGAFSFIVMGNCRPATGGADAITPSELFIANIERSNDAGANFAVLVGDTYVDPLEWWDAKWVATHVTPRLSNARP